MNINSRNSMSFGCNYCDAALKKVKVLANIPHSGYEKGCGYDAEGRVKIMLETAMSGGMPHQRAAWNVDQFLRQQINELI